MSKKEKVIVIGEDTVFQKDLHVCIPVDHFITLMENQKTSAIKKCISEVRPFVIGSTGRQRLEQFELRMGGIEEGILEDRCDEEQIVLMKADDEGRTRRIDSVADYSDLIQFITRNK